MLCSIESRFNEFVTQTVIDESFRHELMMIVGSKMDAQTKSQLTCYEFAHCEDIANLRLFRKNICIYMYNEFVLFVYKNYR